MDLAKLRTGLVAKINFLDGEIQRVRDAAIARVGVLQQDINAAQRIVMAIDNDTNGTVKALLADLVELGVEMKKD